MQTKVFFLHLKPDILMLNIHVAVITSSCIFCHFIFFKLLQTEIIFILSWHRYKCQLPH